MSDYDTSSIERKQFLIAIENDNLSETERAAIMQYVRQLETEVKKIEFYEESYQDFDDLVTEAERASRTFQDLLIVSENRLAAAEKVCESVVAARDYYVILPHEPTDGIDAYTLQMAMYAALGEWEESG
jgi:hypothetical protein